MPWLLIAGLGLILFGGLSMSKADIPPTVGPMRKKKLYDLPDVDPKDQKGTYKRDFDVEFLAASDQTGVPFALLKAHALMESSLKLDAFRDENPTGRADRKGWASRGLMQLLWWPGSERWAKYGYDAKRIGDGSILYQPSVNAYLGACLIRDNLKACGGNLRDSINMYNTGRKESVVKAPHDYVNRVLKFYETLIGERIT